MALFAWNFGLPDLDEAVREALGDNSNLNALERNNLVEAVNYLNQSYSIHAVVVTITLLVSAILLGLTLCRVYEIKKFGRYARNNALAVSYSVDSIVWKMLCADLFAIVAASVIVPTYINFVDSDDAYCGIMWKFCILFYMMLNHCCYFVMIHRAKAVLDSPIFASYHKLQKLAWFVKMANYSMFCLYPLPFFTMGYVSLPPSKICMYYSSPAIAIFVVIADTMFSVLLLSLFVIPLISVAKQSEMASNPTTPTTVLQLPRHKNDQAITEQVQKPHSSNVFRGTIRRQCFLTTTALSSTFILAVITALTNRLAGEPTLENVASQAWRSWCSCLFHGDILINIVTIHLICLKSMPTWLRNRIKLSAQGGAQETNNKAGNQRPAVKRDSTTGSSLTMCTSNNHSMNGNQR